ncbi:MAG: hypothetical protein Q8P85_03860 [Pseudomonas sp.]|nr:hypothetical protein [Pseudomonas sp.]
MKKITLLLVGLMASGVASAESVVLTGSSNPVGNAICTLLNEDVSINLSNNVVGGVECTDVGISIAACHTAGRIATRTQDVETCTTATPPVCTTAPASVTGASVAYATTAKGTVTNDYPGTTCDDEAATAAGVATDKVPTL